MPDETDAGFFNWYPRGHGRAGSREQGRKRPAMHRIRATSRDALQCGDPPEPTRGKCKQEWLGPEMTAGAQGGKFLFESVFAVRGANEVQNGQAILSPA